jgi:hypothetical protein
MKEVADPVLAWATVHAEDAFRLSGHFVAVSKDGRTLLDHDPTFDALYDRIAARTGDLVLGRLLVSRVVPASAKDSANCTSCELLRDALAEMVAAFQFPNNAAPEWRARTLLSAIQVLHLTKPAPARSDDPST